MRDYLPSWASSDEGAPIIRTASGAPALALDNKRRAKHQEDYTFMNLDLRGSGEGCGFFLSNDIDNVDLYHVSIDRFKVGVHVAGSNRKHAAGSDGKNHRIALRHGRITSSPNQGWLGSCDDCVIENSYFENHEFAKPKFNHNIYLSAASASSAMVGAGDPTNRSETDVEGNRRATPRRRCLPALIRIFYPQAKPRRRCLQTTTPSVSRATAPPGARAGSGTRIA